MFKWNKKSCILLLGEGNFSFSIDLLKINESGDHLYYVTSFESYEECTAKYGEEARSNINYLKKRGAYVLHGVDACQLENVFKASGSVVFDVIIFQFPHTGRKASIKNNRNLLKSFFISASSIINQENGFIIVTLCAGQGGTPADLCHREHCNSWQIVDMAAFANLILVEVDVFDCTKFTNYSPTGRRNAGNKFDTRNAMSHKFICAGDIPPLLPSWKSLSSSHNESEDRIRATYLESSFLKNRMDLLNKGCDMPQKWLMKQIMRNIVNEVVQFDYTSELLFTVADHEERESLFMQDKSKEDTSYLRPSLTVHLPSIMEKIKNTPKLHHSGFCVVHGPVFNRISVDTISNMCPIHYQLMEVSISSEMSKVLPQIEMLSLHRSDCNIKMVQKELGTEDEGVFHHMKHYCTPDMCRQISNISLNDEKYHRHHWIGWQCQVSSEDSQYPTPATITVIEIDYIIAALNSGVCCNRQALWSLNAKTRASIITALQNGQGYIPTSLYPPKYVHDFSFWIQEDKGNKMDSSTLLPFTENTLLDVLISTADDTLISLELLERYQKDGSKEASVCYRAMYQSHDYALSKHGCNKLQENIRYNISKCLNVVLR